MEEEDWTKEVSKTSKFLDMVVFEDPCTHYKTKGKITLSPMETIILIPSELTHLKSLVRIVRMIKFEKTRWPQGYNPIKGKRKKLASICFG